MRAKRMKMGGVESFEHVQKPATAIQDHVSSPNSIYMVRQACTFETKTSGLISIQTEIRDQSRDSVIARSRVTEA